MRWIRIRRFFLFVTAFACLAAGYLNGGMRDVLHKAILICYECIGIG